MQSKGVHKVCEQVCVENPSSRPNRNLDDVVSESSALRQSRQNSLF